MQRIKKNQLEWLEFELLSDIPHLHHAVFLRQGGVSQGIYHSLNTSFHVGDQTSHVQTNLTLIENHLKETMPHLNKIVAGRGAHTKNVEFVNLDTPTEILECDGLITSTPSISLAMKHADCQIALLYDPIHHCIANIHAGWRGSVLNIYATTIEKLKARFGTNPTDLLVCITPSLGPDEAEFINYKQELPEDFWQFQTRPTYFDFWTISEYQLQNAGVLPHHIEIARLSTYSNPHDYFSYRRDKVTGRHSTYITLQK